MDRCESDYISNLNKPKCKNPITQTTFSDLTLTYMPVFILVLYMKLGFKPHIILYIHPIIQTESKPVFTPDHPTQSLSLLYCEI